MEERQKNSVWHKNFFIGIYLKIVIETVSKGSKRKEEAINVHVKQMSSKSFASITEGNVFV